MPLTFETDSGKLPKAPNPEDPSMPEHLDMHEIQDVAELIEKGVGKEKIPELLEQMSSPGFFNYQGKEVTTGNSPNQEQTVTYIPGNVEKSISRIFEKPHTMRRQQDLINKRNRLIAIGIDILIHLVLLNIGGLAIKKWVHAGADSTSYALFMVLPHIIVIARVLKKHKELG